MLLSNDCGPAEGAWHWGDGSLTSAGRALVFEEERRTLSGGDPLRWPRGAGGQTGRTGGLRSDAGIPTEDRKGRLNTGGRAAMPAVLLRAEGSANEQKPCSTLAASLTRTTGDPGCAPAGTSGQGSAAQ